MIIEFTVGNFRSIKGLQTLSLVATNIVSKDKKIDEDNVFDSGVGIKLLKSIAIYGANGSGKSNIVKALLNMMYFIRDSFSNEEIATTHYEPFLLDKTSKSKPVFYQLVFVIDKKIFRYGFELKRGKVVSEWLFGTATKNEVYYFKREKQEIKINKTAFPEAIGLDDSKTKETTLFLNVVDAFNGTISKSIKNFFKSYVTINTGINDIGFRDLTVKLLENEKSKKALLDFLKTADFGLTDFENIIFEEKDLPEDAPEKIKKRFEKNKTFKVLLGERQVYNSKGEPVGKLKTSFDLFESEGTKKYFNYAGAIIRALDRGKTIVIDEFDSRLHPLITRSLVQLFNSPANKNKAQIIFATHDTNLLDASALRRDQVYFVEKNQKGESLFYSLVNIGGVRNDASFERDYIKGKYGAIPFIGEFKMIN